ncbi:MAG: signal peptidase I [Mollicutes bacterium]|nr:signal peptidase I [Mollicutes bacterium]
MGSIFNNKIFKIVYGTLKTIFFIILILYVVFICVQRLSGNNSVFGFRLFTVATGSMKGVYNVNDVIAVKDFDNKKLKVGDDIAFIGNRGGLENKLVTHRIIKIEEESNGRIFTTKGVKNSVEDPSITESQILGKVVGVVPVVTQINHVVKSQLGFFCLIFWPLVLVIVLEILQTITDIKLENNELQEINKKEINDKVNHIDSNNVDNNDEDKPVIVSNVLENNSVSDDLSIPVISSDNVSESEEIDNSLKEVNIITNYHDDEII